MAKIYNKHSELRDDYDFHRGRAKRFFLLSLFGLIGIALGLLVAFGSGGIAAFLLAVLSVIPILSVLVGSFGLVGFLIIVASIIYMAIMLMLGGYHSNQATILGSGLEGENATADIVSALPEGFYGIQNVVVTFEGKKSELDMVVAGPTGVFIIETKNRNGEIRGNYGDREWTQYKIGRGGTPYSNDFYSPVKQVGTHIYRLAHFLREKGVKVHVDGAVYFSNPEAEVDIYGDAGNIPVFSYREDGDEAIIRYILSGKGELSTDIVRRVCQLLSK